MTKLVTDSDEADGMYLGAVQNSLYSVIQKAIAKHCQIVPERLMDNFADKVSEMHLMCWTNEGSNESGVPDLYGNEAYQNHVQELLKGLKNDSSES